MDFSKGLLLSHLTSVQLDRLWKKAYARMNEGYEDTHPNYGWDWITMRMVKPGWYITLNQISFARKIAIKRELEEGPTPVCQ
jgi:hypothetical protein